jgi:hypothetical protein
MRTLPALVESMGMFSVLLGLTAQRVLDMCKR